MVDIQAILAATDFSPHADLILMGKHSRPGLNGLFLGSVTEALLYGLDRYLLVVTD